MSTVEDTYKQWREDIERIGDDEDGLDVTYVILTPRIKWFKPPLWKIFRWAYKIDKAYLLKNCKPANPVPTNKTDLHIEFSCNKVDNPDIEKAAEYLRNQWQEYMKKQDKEK